MCSEDKTKEKRMIYDLFGRNYQSSLAGINNGDNDHYQQPNPKLRVLAALRDKLAKEQ